MATPAAAAAATAAAAAIANPAGERREPGVGRFHLPAEPAEPARPGLADTFQLGAHLSSAHRGKADRNALLSHWNDPSVR